MPPAETMQIQVRQSDRVARVGGWLFRQRTWLPVPIVAALLIIPNPKPSALLLAAGLATVTAGEALRLWAVRNIGVISRTRSDRLGPLIRSGPFGLVRNPLYIGNILLWIGFAISAGMLWFVPIILIVLGAEYHAIVRWEEGHLEERLGEPYRMYKAEVGRWLPGSRQSRVANHPSTSLGTTSSVVEESQTASPFSWGETLFSERGTLIAIAVGYGLLWVKFAISG
jgi:protein-S-isoprenylcysteine O-methyltransferase Ste14